MTERSTVTDEESPHRSLESIRACPDGFKTVGVVTFIQLHGSREGESFKVSTQDGAV